MPKIRQFSESRQASPRIAARWSGARRSEIRRLHLNCLDTYPDGTPRLRLAAGKSQKERTVPVHEEAAEAIRTLAAIRRTQGDRGIIDPQFLQDRAGTRPVCLRLPQEGPCECDLYLTCAKFVTTPIGCAHCWTASASRTRCRGRTRSDRLVDRVAAAVINP